MATNSDSTTLPGNGLPAETLATLLDPAEVEATVECVFNDALYWFPVRHHSPTVARHVEAAILQRRPKVVFIEGPSEAGDLIPHVIDRQTRPPVALYSSYRDDDNVLGLAGIANPSETIPARFAIWYPLLDYSPEYVAMQAAAKVGADVVFIDLPHYALIQPADSTPESAPEAADMSSQRPDSDHLLTTSRFYQVLAEHAGYRTWDQAWDSLFEFGHYGRDHDTFRLELATFCAAARATASVASMTDDGTLARERFMWRTICETLDQRHLAPDQTMVICGGFHIFLDQQDTTPPPTPPNGSVYTAVVPYSFFRVSELSGYAAGNRAPRFYQSFWDLGRKADPANLLVQHVVETLKRVRREGEAVSSADAIAISQHARMLASLRGRPTPILDDIHDAIFTCCCKGDPATEGQHLRKAMDIVDIGSRLGKVTPKLGRLPLVNDFYDWVQAYDWGEALGREGRLNITLDKQDAHDRERAAFLHRLQFLKIPFVTQLDHDVSHGMSGALFRERWQLHWGPNVEPALIEENLYGDTIAAAALARLRDALALEANHAGHICTRLYHALNMELPDLLPEIETACGHAIAADDRFVSLSEALAHLALIHRHAIYDQMRPGTVEALIEHCFERACFTISGVISAPEAEQEAVVNALRVVGEQVTQNDSGRLDRALFVQHVSAAATQSAVPFLRGAFLGMLVELRHLSPDTIHTELIAYAQAPPDRLVQASVFLQGVLAVSQLSILLGANRLVAAIDTLLQAAEWDAFLTMLPHLRAAFGRLQPQQRHSIAACVAQLYGLAETESLTELHTSVAASALFARIDNQVADLMQKWEL